MALTLLSPILANVFRLALDDGATRAALDLYPLDLGKPLRPFRARLSEVYSKGPPTTSSNPLD